VAVFRVSLFVVFAVAMIAQAGCAGTWDTLTSKRFRDQPMATMQHMVSPEDPVMVIRSNAQREGDELAAAMHRLKEPLRNNGTREDQDAIIDYLARTATSDPSPVLRMEAVGALGRFQDPRVPAILINAYRSAHGRKESEPAPTAVDHGVAQAGLSAGRKPTIGIERFPLTGPTGYPAEWTASIRCRALDALGRTNSPEAVQFLSAVAGASGRDIAVEGGDDREVRLAAIRGLGKCRQPESVQALAQVLTAESDKTDVAIKGRTHEGLVRLTGKRLPPDPQKWNEVVQAGVVLAPEPTWWDDAVENAVRWVK
jgi:PBS lyase HEAT-like repeat-containing protein